MNMLTPLLGQILGGSASGSPLEAVKEYDRQKSMEDAQFQMYKRGKDSESMQLNGVMDSSIKQINAMTENGKKINI